MNEAPRRTLCPGRTRLRRLCETLAEGINFSSFACLFSFRKKKKRQHNLRRTPVRVDVVASAETIRVRVCRSAGARVSRPVIALVEDQLAALAGPVGAGASRISRMT